MKGNEENVIELACPHCGVDIDLKEEMAGRTTKCPSCGKQLIVPHPPKPPDDQSTPESKEGETSAVGEFAGEVTSGVVSEVFGCVSFFVVLGVLALIVAAICSCVD